MSMIADAIGNPDASKYGTGEKSEEEMHHDQFCQLKSLLDGAAAILRGTRADCDGCDTALELLEAFEAGMDAIEEAMQKVECKKEEWKTPEELAAIIRKSGGMVCIYSLDREPIKEWFRVTAGPKPAAIPEEE